MPNDVCDNCGDILPQQPHRVHVTKEGKFCSYQCMRALQNEIAITVERVEADEWYGHSTIFGDGKLGEHHHSCSGE